MSQSSTRSGDEQSEISKRKDFFAKLAKRTVLKSEKLRLQRVQEEQSPDNGTDIHRPWLTGVKKDAWEADQLAYTKQFADEYQCGMSNNTDSLNDNCSSAASIVSDNDKVTSLRSARGRVFKSRMATMSTRSSVVDFELTSTIQPPSVMTSSEEYTSNISVDDLRSTYFSSVVMISGKTGCGKTTQVPTYILEDAILARRQTRAPVVYVTQPRRIAARSIARRVCEEHNWDVGSIVGYQVGLDRKVGPDTVLIFCTAGVLLQKLITEKSLKSYTHIIVDEAHERDADTDLLLMFIRLLMRQEMSYFRLIVMSATMDMTKLKSYFTFKTNYGHRAMTTPSIVKIEGKEPNDIQILYLDQIQRNFGVDVPMPDFDLMIPELHEDCLKAAYKIIIDVIPNLDTFSGATESTLVFLPGLAEISKLHNMLKRAQDHLDIIPLHSCLSPTDHDRVFLDSEAGRRKVILATNIAESSITVKDVGFIIDFCLTKVLMKDNVTNFPALILQWSTIDKSTQRAGRTGRCCPGKVFRMVNSEFYKMFKPYAEPELLAAPLELSVLRVKSFNMGEVKALLAVVLDPPPINDIRSAVLELKQIGALSSTCEGKICAMDGDMTELGRVIAALPIDVHLSKLIVLASVLDVLEDAIIVAACLSTNRTVVKHLYGNQPETYRMKLEWAKGSYSDLFVSLDVFKDYMEQLEKKKDQAFLINYCNNKHLDERKLHEVSSLVAEIKHRLEGVNIKVLDQPNRMRNIYEDELMLKIAFCASFYPNYFLTQEMDVEDIQKALCGFDPTKTLIVHNIPVNQVPLYRTQILEQVTGIKKSESNEDRTIVLDNDIEYIADCSRALMVFSDKSKMLTDDCSSKAIGVSGLIKPARDMDKSIFMALKLGYWDRYHVREYREEAAVDRMQYYKDQLQRLPMTGRLTPPWTKIVAGRPADNRRIIEASDEEYSRMVENFHVEVEFNETQDYHDRTELLSLEQREKQLETVSKMNPLQNLQKEIDHPLFKPGKKFISCPTSPIQMTFRSILEKSKGYKVDIDSLSVNSILLNPDYAEPRRQMLVAAAVNQTAKSRIRACDTTLMPNIRGLPTLMALLFAQYYRIVYDQTMNCVAGAIFGLGWDDDDKPIDKSYEVELGFDIQITKDDIELINIGRKNISELIKFIDVQNPGAPRAQLQQQLRQIILKLIKRRRFPLEEICVAAIDWSSDRYFKDKHNVPKQQLTRLEEGKSRIFLPIMEVTKEYAEFDMYKAIRANLEYLNEIEKCNVIPPKEPVHCLLCGRNNSFLLYGKIVKHINDQSHIERLEMFEIQEERARLRQSSPEAES